MARMLFDPETHLTAHWVRVVTHNGRRFALFPYISALTPVPAFASVLHQINGTEITAEELRELAALIKQRGEGGGWVWDGADPWLVTPMERDNVEQREAVRLPKNRRN
jgi:hypothetical protein